MITKEEYNNEPVFYCVDCLSLKIKNLAETEGLDYCDDCGSTNIDSCHIEEWEEKYINKHKHGYLEEY